MKKNQKEGIIILIVLGLIVFALSSGLLSFSSPLPYTALYAPSSLLVNTSTNLVAQIGLGAGLMNGNSYFSSYTNCAGQSSVLNNILIIVNNKSISKITSSTPMSGWNGAYTTLGGIPIAGYGISSICEGTSGSCTDYILPYTPKIAGLHKASIVANVTYCQASAASSGNGTIINKVITSGILLWNGTFNVSGGKTLSGSTTTIKMNTTLQSSPPSPPAWSWTSLLSGITSFFNSIISSLAQYFAVPSGNLFSVGVQNLQAVNTTYINTNLNISTSLQVANVSNAWSAGVNKVTRTSCASYIIQNKTYSYLYQSPVVNQTSSTYSYNFYFKPTIIGVVVIGASCLSSSTTYNNGAWSVWSTPVLAAQTNRAIAVVSLNTSLNAPVTSVPISNSNFFSSLGNFFAGIIQAIANFFSSL